MFRLLIIDDEKFVLDTMRSTYPWESYGIDVVETSNSPTEALARFKSSPFDIIITDIKMPGMNGLELIQEIKKISNKTKCILLTGYSDFTYAQQAIQNDVFEYLLKPVKESDLKKTITNVIENIKNEWEKLVTYKRIQHAFNENLPHLRQTFLNNLLMGRNYSHESLDKKLNELRLPINHSDPFLLMAIRFESGFERFSSMDFELIDYAILNISEEVFHEKFNLWLCKDIHDYLMIIIMKKTEVPETLENLFETAEALTFKFQQYVKQFLNGNISIVLSPPGIFPEDIAGFYSSALLKLLKHLEIENNGYFITPKSDSITKIDSTVPLHILYEPPTLSLLLESGRWAEAEKRLEYIFDTLTEDQSLNREHLLEASLYFAHTAAYIIHKNGYFLADSYNEYFEIFQKPNSIGSVEQLKKWTEQIIRMIRSKAMDEFKNEQKFIMEQIHTYIDKNLHMDVSLQSIAEHIHLHPAYLSKVYKDLTGENLSDYITRIRMEKAAYLLRTTNEKVNAIASKIGYINPSHFIKVFKKYYETTPNDFRKNS
jgi:two-component system response regulator YesN